MKRVLIVILLGIVFLSATLSITSCASKSSLVGKWKRISLMPTPGERGEMSLMWMFLPDQLEFFDDGKYASDNLISILPGGEWKVVENNKIRLSTRRGIVVFTFSIDGDILTLTDDKGTSMQFRRVK